MNFKNRKLPISEGRHLKKIRVEALEPARLLFSPLYIYMSLNKKYLAIKGPLDFLTVEEIRKLESLPFVYFSKFIDRLYPVRKMGEAIREVLSLEPRRLKTSSQASEAETLFPLVDLPVATYEISDRILKLLAPIWSYEWETELYLLSVLAEEVCGSLPVKILHEAREKSLQDYEQGHAISAWAIFLALQLGVTDLAVLVDLRKEAFQTAQGKEASFTGFFKQIIELSQNLPTDFDQKIAVAEFWKRCAGLEKIEHRIKRIQKEKLNRPSLSASALGPEGLFEVQNDG